MPSKGDREYSWQEWIDEESSRSVPIIRAKGFSVWSVVGYYLACKGDRDRVLVDYAGTLTSEELAAALAYYRANPEAINRKLEEISS